VILYVNPAFEHTTGYTKKEILGQTPRILKSGKHELEFYKNLWDTILGGRTFQETLINKRKNGELYYADQTITPIHDANGKILYFISIWKDVTERMQAREELRRLHEHLKFEKQKLEKILNFGEQIETIRSLDKLVDFIVGQAASILDSDRCSLMLMDEHSEELCIKAAIGLQPDVITKSKLSIGEGIAGLVAKEGKPMLVEVVDADERINRGNLPGYRTKSFLSAPVKLGGKFIGVINVTEKNGQENPTYDDIDLKILLAIGRQVAIAIENAQLSKELKYLTIKDPLTALYNHRYLMECLAYEIRRFKRFERPLCLLIMDLDDFKQYNDAYGHKEGDILLKKVGHILQTTFREVDVVCRYAADEYVAILPETEEVEVKRIAELISGSVSHLKLKRPVTMSMGIAKCQKDMNRHDFILKADAALSKAKKDGKNKIYCQSKLKD
jgi:diguanylate cyclase (GGDEF)-like protein/PAS domain S-box-containing protein